MPSKIPAYVREDGTFCVVVEFETIQDATNLRDQVTQWCNEWIEENKTVHRVGISDDLSVDDVERLPDYFEIFTSPPYIIKAEDDQLWLRLDGMYSYWWRDWLARIGVSLTRALPELRLHKISINCGE
ncbi:MAG: hypothetical protein ABI947_19950 [Chloroflexota bacterium]